MNDPKNPGADPIAAIMAMFDDCVWCVQDLRAEISGAIVGAYERPGPARAHAERLVGNRAAATMPDGWAYGDGTGDTTVMVRKLPRRLALRDGLVVEP